MSASSDSTSAPAPPMRSGGGRARQRAGGGNASAKQALTGPVYPADRARLDVKAPPPVRFRSPPPPPRGGGTSGRVKEEVGASSHTRSGSKAGRAPVP